MKKSIIYILAVMISLALAGASQAVTVDGVFDDTGEWAGYHADDDGVGSNGFVNPGWGGQDFDVEYLGLKITGNTVYFGLQTGFDLSDGVVVSDGTTYYAGDIAINVDGDSFFEYAIDFSVSGGVPSYSLYQVNSWDDPYFSSSSPYKRDSASLLYGSSFFDGAYGSGVFANNTDSGTSYVLEGSFDLSLLALYSGGDIGIHWTMSCGNDVLDFSTTPVVTPEPSTYILLGSAMAGLMAWRRRQKGIRNKKKD